MHGKIFNVETPFGLKTIIPLYHPAVATYDGRKITVLLEDFKTLKKFLC